MKTGIGRAKSVHFSRRLCLRLSSGGNSLENCGPEKLYDLSRRRPRKVETREFEQSRAYRSEISDRAVNEAGDEIWNPGDLVILM